jgi:hypothetical protein
LRTGTTTVIFMRAGQPLTTGRAILLHEVAQASCA